MSGLVKRSLAGIGHGGGDAKPLDKTDDFMKNAKFF